MGVKTFATCDHCDKDLKKSWGEYEVVCQDCYDRLEAENEDLRDEVEELKAEINKLEEKLEND